MEEARAHHPQRKWEYGRTTRFAFSFCFITNWILTILFFYTL